MQSSLNKWYVLVLVTLIWLLVFSFAWSGVAVLFPEIASDLNLNYAEIGLIWGGVSIGIAAFVLIGGVLGDHFGTRVIIGFACFLGAISSFLRGVANSFIALAMFMALFGVAEAAAEGSLSKKVVTVFKGKSLGLIHGIQFSGFYLGGATSMMVSATILSPMFGGWRGVMYLYGIIAIIIGILWVVTIRDIPTTSSAEPTGRSLSKTILRVIHSRDLWLDGIALLMLFFSIKGIMGYMPIYLVNVKGMEIGEASNITSAFLGGGIIGGLTLPVLSDRVGRKIVYIPSVVIAAICIYLIPILSSLPLLAIIVACGVFTAGAATIHWAVVAESRGIEPAYYGTAFGLLSTMGSIGGFLGPAIGGIIAEIDESLPFVLWAGVLSISVIAFYLIKGQAPGQREGWLAYGEGKY